MSKNIIVWNNKRDFLYNLYTNKFIYKRKITYLFILRKKQLIRLAQMRLLQNLIFQQIIGLNLMIKEKI